MRQSMKKESSSIRQKGRTCYDILYKSLNRTPEVSGIKLESKKLLDKNLHSTLFRNIN